MSIQRVSYSQEEVLQKFGDSRFQITPETFKMGIHQALGRQIAKRFVGKKIVADACAGAGFMSIFLAEVVPQVISVEENAARLELLKHNVAVAGSENKVKPVLGDILNPVILSTLTGAEAVYVDPDWALPGDSKGNHVTSPDKLTPSVEQLLAALFPVSKNIAVRLPKEVDLRELEALPPHETEEAFLEGKQKFYTIYFGDLMRREGMTVLRLP